MREAHIRRLVLPGQAMFAALQRKTWAPRHLIDLRRLNGLFAPELAAPMPVFRRVVYGF